MLCILRSSAGSFLGRQSIEYGVESVQRVACCWLHTAAVRIPDAFTILMILLHTTRKYILLLTYVLRNTFFSLLTEAAEGGCSGASGIRRHPRSYILYTVLELLLIHAFIGIQYFFIKCENPIKS